MIDISRRNDQIESVIYDRTEELRFVDDPTLADIGGGIAITNTY